MMKVQFVCVFLCVLFLFSSFHVAYGDEVLVLADKETFFSHISVNESRFYGFIIPLPSGEDSTAETVQISRVFYLINDLLREGIDVGWLHEEITSDCIVFPSFDHIVKRTFVSGDFVVPFTGDADEDARIITIISDYVLGHELDPDALEVTCYLVTSSFNVHITFLTEPRIAQHLGTPTRYGWPCYLLIADAGGFFSFDFLLDDETASQLSNEAYNVFMWPYEPDPANGLEVLKSLTNEKGCKQVRDFVRNGGGFIGSCYGALVASAGFPHLLSPLHLLTAKWPFLSCVPGSLTLCLSDSLMNERPAVLNDLYLATSSVCSIDHPLTYNINRTVHEFFSGPWFVFMGEKTIPLAYFSDVSKRNSDPSPAFIDNQVHGSPSWAVSSFGDGRLVLFASHPEFVNNISFLFNGKSWPGDPYYGRRVIFNSLFHVVSEQPIDFSSSDCHSISFIAHVITGTNKVDLPDQDQFLFPSLLERLESYIARLSSLQVTADLLQEKYKSVFDESQVFPTSSRPLLYCYHFSEILINYTQRTMLCLQQINDVSMIYSNRSFDQEVLLLSGRLDSLLDDAISQINKVTCLSDRVNDFFQYSSLSLFDRIQLVSMTRDMITTLEISLKFTPMLFFESAKTLRHHWYEYELSLV